MDMLCAITISCIEDKSSSLPPASAEAIQVTASHPLYLQLLQRQYNLLLVIPSTSSFCRGKTTYCWSSFLPPASAEAKQLIAGHPLKLQLLQRQKNLLHLVIPTSDTLDL
ncbi:hypothetical protein RRG08_005517 [Elysia crispata]|uniref:Uncharacterized protein n=1 Tax=Elysia crispata TaxID=231223 RepID=A0AAE0XR97_9GAST|nr:hypothetical protein RRG08_005517 [Elysia crispata]